MVSYAKSISRSWDHFDQRSRTKFLREKSKHEWKAHVSWQGLVLGITHHASLHFYPKLWTINCISSRSYLWLGYGREFYLIHIRNWLTVKSSQGYYRDHDRLTYFVMAGLWIRVVLALCLQGVLNHIRISLWDVRFKLSGLIPKACWVDACENGNLHPVNLKWESDKIINAIT